MNGRTLKPQTFIFQLFFIETVKEDSERNIRLNQPTRQKDVMTVRQTAIGLKGQRGTPLMHECALSVDYAFKTLFGKKS